MPSYSPSETSTEVSVGLSPKSQAAFEARDRHRNRINDDDFFQDVDDNKIDDDEESSFDPYDDDSDDPDIFQFEDNFTLSAKQQANLKALTFWYGNEEDIHIKRIFSTYEKELSSLFTCTHKTDARRLPLFVGSIKRTPLKFDEIDLSSDVLATIDEIGIYRRDIRQCGSTTTLVKVLWSVTSWDRDGLPRTFQKLSDESAKKKMSALKQETKNNKKFKLEPTYLYAFPVWESKTEFKYQVSTEKMEIGYADQPFNYTSFLPKEYFDNLEDYQN